ncbi:MAG: AAA family ATPase [Gemmatimonadetes bacterium]|nr:AAA family ATPase [Gemmatimonadota bacterium]
MARYSLRTLTPRPRLMDKAGGVEHARFSKQLAVLIYLASRPERRATRDELIGLLWEGSSEQEARQALRQVVYQLRRSTDQSIVTGEGVLAMDRDLVEFDVDVFRRHLAEGRAEEALAVYEDDFLAHVALSGARDFEEWADGMRWQLLTERRQLLRTLIAGAVDAGDWPRAVHYAELQIASDAEDLKARLKLVELLALAGDAVRANAAAEEVRRLAIEIEGEPLSAATEASIARALAPMAAPERRQQTGFPRQPEMVGRSEEFRRLVMLWKRAMEGQGGAVLVSGEAGIGKTRLAQEVQRRFRGDRGLVLHGSCFAIEQSDPYAPFLDLLREGHGAPGLAGAAPASLAILAAFVPEIADRFRPAVTPRALPIPPQAFAGALVDAFAAIAEEVPLALLVDQLHWGSPTTIEFAHRLARRAATCRMLLVFLARDFGGPSDTMHALYELGRSEALTVVDLAPLDVPDAEHLVGSIAHLPEDPVGKLLPARLVDRTAGIPLYVLEALKALYDAGELSVQGGAWVLGSALLDPARPLPVPESTDAILQSRLAAVGDAPLAVLAALAIRERGTSPEDLARITELSEPEVREALAVLERRRLVGRPKGVPRVAHDELGLAAQRAIAPPRLRALQLRSADLTLERAERGDTGQWAAAAQYYAAAGDAPRAALSAVRAAEALERASGREAARHALARIVEAAPSTVRRELQHTLGDVLSGKTSVRRWLDEQQGRRRGRRVAATAATVLVALAGILGLVRVLRLAAAPPPLGSGLLAVAFGPPGRTDSVQALRLDSSYVARRVKREELPVGVRDGFTEREVSPDLRVVAVRCAVPGVAATAICTRSLVSGDTVPQPLAWYDVSADFVGWMPDGGSLLMLGGYLRPDSQFARALVLTDSGGSPPFVIARDRYDYPAASLSPAGDRLIVERMTPEERRTDLVTLGGMLVGAIDWCSIRRGVAWARDGERIACVSEDGRALLLGYPFSGSRPTRVALPEPITGAAAWAPNGSFVAVIAGDAEPALYVVDRLGLAEPRLALRWDAPVRLLGWTGTRPALIVRTIRVRPETLGVEVCERQSLRVAAYGDAGLRLATAAGVRWSALDTAVARVSQTGEVVGVRAGVTRVIASFGLAAADTVVVRVGGTLRR